MDIEGRKNLRIIFLKKLYEMTEGDTSRQVNVGEMGIQLGMNDEDFDKLKATIDFLENAGMLECIRLAMTPAFARITHKGVVEIENIISALSQAISSKNKRIVFYSWQSDLPNSTNRGFIQNALERAVRDIIKGASMTVEPARGLLPTHQAHITSCPADRRSLTAPPQTQVSKRTFTFLSPEGLPRTPNAHDRRIQLSAFRAPRSTSQSVK